MIKRVVVSLDIRPGTEGKPVLHTKKERETTDRGLRLNAERLQDACNASRIAAIPEPSSLALRPCQESSVHPATISCGLLPVSRQSRSLRTGTLIRRIQTSSSNFRLALCRSRRRNKASSFTAGNISLTWSARDRSRLPRYRHTISFAGLDHHRRRTGVSSEGFSSD